MTAVPNPLSGRVFLYGARLYQRAVVAAFALSPAGAIAYLAWVAPSGRLFIDHEFHEAAIALAVAISLFLAYLAHRCHKESGEPLTRYLSLGYLGFGLLYAPHGALTMQAHDQPALFLLWGPVSRLVMSALVLRAVSCPPRWSGQATPPSTRWLPWLGGFAAIGLATAWLAVEHPGWLQPARLGIEAAAGLAAFCGVAALLLRRASGPMLMFHVVALTWFILSSASFILAKPWDAQWWLAHAISAAGFLLLGAGVAHVFRTSSAFSAFYGPETMFSLLSNAERMAHELRRAKEEAELSSRAKMSFFAAANHDLRQPTHAMGLCLEVLRTRLDSGQPASHVIEHMQKAQQALLHILDGLLDVSRLDADLVAVDPTDFPVEPLLLELAEEARLRTAGKPLDILVLPAAGMMLRTDRQLLRRILSNLLDNALKFTPRGRITLRCQSTGDRLRIGVQDTGPGIPPALQGSIFHEFVRLNDAGGPRIQGLGLGLAIVQRLSALIGGTVGLISQPGSGAEFWVELPIPPTEDRDQGKGAAPRPAAPASPLPS